jgi:hypothetical protein
VSQLSAGGLEVALSRLTKWSCDHSLRSPDPIVETSSATSWPSPISSGFLLDGPAASPGSRPLSLNSLSRSATRVSRAWTCWRESGFRWSPRGSHEHSSYRPHSRVSGSHCHSRSCVHFSARSLCTPGKYHNRVLSRRISLFWIHHKESSRRHLDRDGCCHHDRFRRTSVCSSHMLSQHYFCAFCLRSRPPHRRRRCC